MKILAIDPGNKESAYCVMDSEYRILQVEKVDNDTLREFMIMNMNSVDWFAVVIERVASYGMAVGREVFETCEWIGRYTERAVADMVKVDYVYRLEEKMRLCHDSKAKDPNIRKALIDRFAKHDLKNGKGTKKNPDMFYGVSGTDEWSAIAVAVTYLDRITEEKDIDKI
jgi:hypothetical protein